MIKLLLWIGFVKWGRKSTLIKQHEMGGEWHYVYPLQIIWPFHAPPYHLFRFHLRTKGERFYIFRNVPGVIKWQKGRLLPRRWGFGICGFEFGDRG